MAGVALGGAGFWFWWGAGRTDKGGSGAGRYGRGDDLELETELARRNREIAFYEGRVSRDPQGSLDLARLASLYLQRARETGDHADLHRAESAARRSLANSSRRNEKASLALASSLVGQHRFTEALEVMRALASTHPEMPAYRAALGEIQLELGDYESADTTFAALAGDVEARGNLAIAPRLARWAEIMGRPQEALAILVAAREEATRRGNDLPPEQLAWFHLRVGDVLARGGRSVEAEESYLAGLDARPGDHRLHAALARLSLGRRQWRGAIQHARQAIAVTSEPAALLLLGDAYTGVGDTARAEDCYRDAERRFIEHQEPYNRAWTLFQLEYRRRPIAELVALLKQEIHTRRDIYGYDLLAWALYKQGDFAAAREVMASALRTGARDALIFFHAGMIERALGSNEAAHRHLGQAIEINPHFHPTHPALARAVLDSLGGFAAGGSAPPIR
jgi:tetratricopeptide (TPR) repeat protein